MKKILFVAIDKMYIHSLSLRLRQYGNKKEFVFLSANTTEDVKSRCVENPDITTVILVGYLIDIPFDEPVPNTVPLVGEIRGMLGSGVSIYTASPLREFNVALMRAGCDETIDLGRISERLATLL